MVRRLVLVLGLAVAASCGGASVSSGPACGQTQQEQAECLREIGFASVDGLEVGGVDEEQGRDTLVRFHLEGSSEAIDRALQAAEFTTVMKPGPDEFQIGPEVDLTKLDEIHSAGDRWVDAHDVPINRQILRGQVRGRPGTELVYVQGFTT